MSEDQGNKSSHRLPGPPQRMIITPPPVARSARRTVDQVLTTTSTDAFSTPSDAPPAEPQVFSGPEPAIFGGVNPPTSSSAQLPAAPADILGITVADQADTEDEVTSGPIVRANPRNTLNFVRRSNAMLIVLLAVSIAVGTWAVVETIPAESYVHTTIHLRSDLPLTPDEADSQHAEINTVLRTYPLRAAAKTLLTNRAPNLTPGFLDGLMLADADAITWEDADTFSLRINTTKPAEDGPRLAATADAFMQVARSREFARQERKNRLANFKLHLGELHRQQAELKSDLKTQLPGVAPTTTATSAAADFGRTLQSRVDATLADIAREQRALDTWLSPERLDPAGVQAYDKRPLRRNTLLAIWAGLTVLFGLPMLLNGLRFRRAARERRQKYRARLRPQAKPS